MRISKTYTAFFLIHVLLQNPVSGQDFLVRLESHFDNLITMGKDTYGEEHTPVWMSSIDLATQSYPRSDERPAHIPSRVYLDRSVDAPKGATLYWDLPDIAAAYHVSRLTGNDQYKKEARAYVEFILGNCTSENGVILWGNHYYYDAFQDQCVRFKSSEKPVPINPESENGDLHEMRPFSPPWDILWEIDSSLIQKHILEALDHHIVNKSTGEFNRHADQESGYAFLEYGGILVYTLSWLYQKTGDESLIQTAGSIIDFSYGFRNENTGLIENSPTVDRWDKYTSTTEIGLWGNYILKAAELVPEESAKQWIKRVEEVVSSWLQYGYDHKNQQFFGGLNVADGTAYKPDEDYPYQPGYYAEIWNPLFPTHNYPMQLAECCLQLYQLTGKDAYKTIAEQWIQHIRIQIKTVGEDQLLYAENYARVLHFLLQYKQVFGTGKTETLVEDLINEALNELYSEKYQTFRSHTGELRYDAVDGTGLLSLVLLWYITGEQPEECVYFF